MIDTGVSKVSGYNPRVEMSTLPTRTISKASARQRAGRAGRTKPGTCFRLYTSQDFELIFPPASLPDIIQSEGSNMILKLKAMGYNDIPGFDFIDSPHPEVILSGTQVLQDL